MMRRMTIPGTWWPFPQSHLSEAVLGETRAQSCVALPRLLSPSRSNVIYGRGRARQRPYEATVKRGNVMQRNERSVGGENVHARTCSGKWEMAGEFVGFSPAPTQINAGFPFGLSPVSSPLFQCFDSSLSQKKKEKRGREWTGKGGGDVCLHPSESSSRLAISSLRASCTLTWRALLFPLATKQYLPYHVVQAPPTPQLLPPPLKNRPPYARSPTFPLTIQLFCFNYFKSLFGCFVSNWPYVTVAVFVLTVVMFLTDESIRTTLFNCLKTICLLKARLIWRFSFHVSFFAELRSKYPPSLSIPRPPTVFGTWLNSDLSLPGSFVFCVPLCLPDIV